MKRKFSNFTYSQNLVQVLITNLFNRINSDSEATTVDTTVDSLYPKLDILIFQTIPTVFVGVTVLKSMALTITVSPVIKL